MPRNEAYMRDNCLRDFNITTQKTQHLRLVFGDMSFVIRLPCTKPLRHRLITCSPLDFIDTRLRLSTVVNNYPELTEPCGITVNENKPGDGLKCKSLHYTLTSHPPPIPRTHLRYQPPPEVDEDILSDICRLAEVLSEKTPSSHEDNIVGEDVETGSPSVSVVNQVGHTYQIQKQRPKISVIGGDIGPFEGSSDGNEIINIFTMMWRFSQNVTM